jgi:CRP/FNR family transcriptional regulator
MNATAIRSEVGTHRLPVAKLAPLHLALAPSPRASAPVPVQRWRESLALIEQHLPFTRRTVHAGDVVQSAGHAFTALQIVNSGVFKTVNFAADGREQVVGLHFKGDWIGFDGIATGRCAVDAIAMDTGEIWTLQYAALLKASATTTALMHAVHTAMSGQLARDREWLLALGSLPAEARVADFVRFWAESLAERGLRTDQITLRMTRAEIGNYLGMTRPAGAPRADPLRREGPARHRHPQRRGAGRLRAQHGQPAGGADAAIAAAEGAATAEEAAATAAANSSCV